MQTGEAELEYTEWHTQAGCWCWRNAGTPRRGSRSVPPSRVLGTTTLHSNGVIQVHREALHGSSLQISTGSLNL